MTSHPVTRPGLRLAILSLANSEFHKWSALGPVTEPIGSDDGLLARAPHQQSPKTHQNQPRLVQADTPQYFPGFVSRIGAKRVFCGIVQQIDKPAVVGLLEIVQAAAEEEMEIEFPAQSA